MTSDGQSIERLREYLQTLKPEARSMLVQELERGLLRGGESAGNQIVLQELRRAVRAAAQPVPRIGDAARLFFAPLEPFLIDAGAEHKRVGRIARVSLEPIWSWIGRDLMAAEAKALSEDINRALFADDRTKAEQLVSALHERAILRMKDTMLGSRFRRKSATATRRSGRHAASARKISARWSPCCRCAMCSAILPGACPITSAFSIATKSIR